MIERLLWGVAVVGAFLVGQRSEDIALGLVAGKPALFVLKEDVLIRDQTAEGAGGSHCKRNSWGGIMKGTPVQLRRMGSVNRVKVKFRLLGVDLPMSPVASEDEARLQSDLNCDN